MYVEAMHTPGAARSTAGPKFEKNANVSSVSVRQPGNTGASPPGLPSKSAIAETVMTSGYAAGTKTLASDDALPAATAYVTPAATDLQMARWRGSPFVRPQLPS